MEEIRRSPAGLPPGGRLAACVLLLALLPAACSGREGPVPRAAPSDPDDGRFAHRVITHVQAEARAGVATGDFYMPGVLYPPVPVDPAYRRVLCFQMAAFAPPLLESAPTSGPIVLYSDAMDVLVFSPMDHFFESVVWYADGRLYAGLQGMLEEVPAGFEHRFLLVEGRGLAATLERWGDLLLADRGRTRTDRYADVGAGWLGYWTDNGAYYYYRTEPGMNAEETLLAVKGDAEARAIPYRYVQLDSWWYFKEPGPPLPFLTGGLLSWKPMPDAFPDGLEAFRDRIGLPLITHNKWFAPASPYRDRYDFVEGEDLILPTGRGVYDEFMADAASWGVATYEPDWLFLQSMSTPWLLEGAGRARAWMENIYDAARDAGLTLQLCMAAAAHLMDAAGRPEVTSVRTSIDCHAGVSKESYWPMFHTVNAMAWALGHLPFKDNFQTAEPWGEAEALVALLSAGMVGPADAVGAADAELLNRTCRADGLLLKPDRPALPLDAMFLPHRRPHTVSTFSRRPGLGAWTYLAAFHLARNHPDRRLADRLFALVTYDFRDLGTFFVWPDTVTDWRVDLEADLGIRGPVVAYDWRDGAASLVAGLLEMAPREGLYDHAYYVLAPVLANGLALIGEPDKFATLADRRFVSVDVEADALAVTLAGVPGERVTLLAYDARNERMLPAVTAAIGIDGGGAARLAR